MNLLFRCSPNIILAIVFCIFTSFSAASDRIIDSPNFILILLDDYGWSSLSETMDKNYPDAKSDFYQTPNMNKILERGIRFSNGYASSPVCSPTRYSIQFGKDPASLGRTRGLGPNNVDHDRVGIPQILKGADSNYVTAHFGKWHIDADPSRYGYDEHHGESGNRAGGFDTGKNNRQWVGYAADDPKLVNKLTADTIDFMERALGSGKPFFVQLSHYAVHSDIVYSEDAYDRVGKRKKGSLHRNQGYAAMVDDLDLSIGDLLDAYDRLDLRENTYLILVSDNGGMPVLPQKVNLGKPYKPGLNYPLVRGKWDVMEGGIRIPFALMGPSITANSQSDTPVVTHDLLPTIADLANANRYTPEDIDGGSLKKLFLELNANVDRNFDALIFHYPHYNRVGMNEPHSAIRLGDHKLVNFPVSKRSLLFNIKNDPGEQKDLSDQLPDLVTKLQEKLSNFLESVDAENPEDAYNWKTTGKSGEVRTKFFERYKQ